MNYQIHLMHGDRNISNKKIWQMNLLKKLMLVLTYQRTSQNQMFLYDYLGSRTMFVPKTCFFLKPVDEKQVINMVKAYTKNFAQTLKM